MRVTSKGQVTIPKNVRESMGILPSETEIEFLQDESGRCYIFLIPMLQRGNAVCDAPASRDAGALCLLKIESPVNKPYVEDTRFMPRHENNGDVSHRPAEI